MFDFLDAAVNENRWQRRSNIFWRNYHPFNKRNINPMPNADSGLYILAPKSYPDIPTLRDHNGTLIQAHRQPDAVIASYSQSNEPSVVVIRCYSGRSFVSTKVRDISKDLGVPAIDKIVSIQSGLAITGSDAPTSIIYSIPVAVLLEKGFVDIEHGTCRLFKDIYSAAEAGLPGNMTDSEDYPTNGNRLSIVVPASFNIGEFYTLLGQRSLKIPVTHSDTIEVPSLIIYDQDNASYTSHEIIWANDNEKEIVVADIRLFKTDKDAYRAARQHLDKTAIRQEQLDVEELRMKCAAEIDEIKKKHLLQIGELNNKFEKDKEDIQHRLEVENRLCHNKVIEREALDEEIRYRNDLLSKIKETIAKEEEKAKMEQRSAKASDNSSMLVKVIAATAVTVTALVTTVMKLFF